MICKPPFYQDNTIYLIFWFILMTSLLITLYHHNYVFKENSPNCTFLRLNCFLLQLTQNCSIATQFSRRRSKLVNSES